jgi:pimeloyl-ACP methyl ester carboxylesterase
MSTVHHRYATVRGRQLFYREAGPGDAPAVVLLHGFPASSFMFRELIPRLADRYHVIAPDHLGFDLSDAPPAAEFGYTFDALAGLTITPRRSHNPVTAANPAFAVSHRSGTPARTCCRLPPARILLTR